MIKWLKKIFANKDVGPSSPIQADVALKMTEQKKSTGVPDAATVEINNTGPYSPELDLPSYKFPRLDLLEEKKIDNIITADELEKNKQQLVDVLKSFGVGIQRIRAIVGPTDTLYEITPDIGVRVSKVTSLKEDIALSLNAESIDIVAPIPGKGAIGISLPNRIRQIVSMRSLIASEAFVNNKMALPVAFGKTMDNQNYIVDLAKLPHLLLAGTTGQGKSICLHAIITSLLYKKHPSQLKFMLIDTKQVELTVYDAIEKHFLVKLLKEKEAIVTDPFKVADTLKALCAEMDSRYSLLQAATVRNVQDYNIKFINRKLNPKQGHKYLPYIVLVIDEYADLIMTAGKEIETPLTRLAQIGRAIGIHLIITTQHPSAEVITSNIKANFIARVAFKVAAKINSRTILDISGAEQLRGKGDMLVSINGELQRIQCPFIDTPELERIVEFIGNQPGYPSAFELP